METTLSLPGASLFYCAVCGIGFILTYLIMPETENYTLEDIELHFSDDTKKITNIKIIKSNDMIPLNDVEYTVGKRTSVKQTEPVIESSLVNDSNSEHSSSELMVTKF